MGADGKPMQVNSNVLQQGGIPNGNGNMVTVMSPDGKPIQVNASALQSAGSQNNTGMIQVGKCHNQIQMKQNCQYVKRKVIK
jgi:hypothetical protein